MPRQAVLPHWGVSTSNGRPSTRPHHVVVGGGGFGGLQAVRQLRMLRVSITLIDRRSFHLFQPLVYQVATGMLGAGEIAAPLRAVFKRDPNVRVMAPRRWALCSPGEAPSSTAAGVVAVARTCFAIRPWPLSPLRDKGTLATIGRAKAVADFRWLRLSGLPARLAWPRSCAAQHRLGGQPGGKGGGELMSEYEQFITLVEQKAKLSRDEAEAATRATLQTLAERISAGQARDLAEQLPPELAPWLATIGGAEPFDVDEFLRRVAEREDTDISRAERDARAVFAALGRSVRRRDEPSRPSCPGLRPAAG